MQKLQCLSSWANQAKTYLEQNPRLYKVTLLVNHLFRAVCMGALMFVLAEAFSPVLACGVCLGGALLYRITVEGNCAFKFALPATFGGFALWTASPPALLGYTAYLIFHVNEEVEAHRKTACCKSS